MSFSKLITFDRKLVGAVLPGQSGRLIGERELAEQTEAAYRRGGDDARALANHQLVEIRTDVQRLSDGVFKQLSSVESALLTQLREALPGLALEIARRFFAGYVPETEMLERLCREALDQLFPEREGLELTLCPQDAELIGCLDPSWMRKYPGLRVTNDPSLSRGDCLVRSRFGLTDARMATKLAALERGLTGE
ncbi:MAG TPA: FliH/SctL family protein [Opitutaceae bacterium]|nr:FliH/SctL family protein [Opitutaceae bacterium]